MARCNFTSANPEHNATDRSKEENSPQAKDLRRNYRQFQTLVQSRTVVSFVPEKDAAAVLGLSTRWSFYANVFLQERPVAVWLCCC